MVGSGIALSSILHSSYFRGLDNHILYWHVLVPAASSGFHTFDFFDDIGAIRHLAKHAISPALRVRGRVIEEVVIGYIDEKLRGRRMRISGSCHCDRVLVILEIVVGFVLDLRAGRLLFHAGLESAALDHESVNDAMKYRVVEVPALDVVQEVLDGDGRFGGIQFESDDAKIGM